MKAKNRVPLYSLFTTSLISVTGDVMAALAVPWFVLQTTGSPTQTGIASAFAIMPIVLAMIFGGTLVDRIGYKRVSVLADLASGITMLMIPLLHLTIGLEFWQLLVLVFASSSLVSQNGIGFHLLLYCLQVCLMALASLSAELCCNLPHQMINAAEYQVLIRCSSIAAMNSASLKVGLWRVQWVLFLRSSLADA